LPICKKGEKMTSIEKYSLNAASFNFSFVTSDGDKIDLKMYDKVKSKSSYKKSGNYVSEELTLKHEFGYEFHYEGNGLSERDKKEIQEAFEKIRPLFEKFIKQKNLNEKIVTNTAMAMKSLLPKARNNDFLNALKQEGVKTFDEILKEVKANMKELIKTKELFDKLFDESKKLEFFA
jgi:hypothetical protein